MLRGERLVQNQALIRDLNEQVDQLGRQLGHAPGGSERLHVFCECANRGCVQLIELARREYESVRCDADAFLVAPGHEVPSIERTIRRMDGYLVVVKFHPETTRIARARGRRSEC
jgi:hypothetical protein